MTAHRYEISASRLLSMILLRRAEILQPDQLDAFLQLLARESEEPVRPVPAQTERSLLEQCAIATGRPRFEQSLHAFRELWKYFQNSGELDVALDVAELFPRIAGQERLWRAAAALLAAATRV